MSQDCAYSVGRRRRHTQCVVLLGLLAATVFSGCQIGREDRLRTIAKVASIGLPAVAKVERVKRPGKIGPVERLFKHPPPPSDRTQQLLRRYSLMDRYQTDPDYVIGWMRNICRETRNMEEVYALAEIALIRGNWLARIGQEQQAQQMFATAMVHAYQFLFDTRLEVKRNAFDPQFRGICDVYNQSLESILRSLAQTEGLQNGASYRIGDAEVVFDLRIELQGRWKAHEFASFELTNDYKMKGISNLYHTYGLGVPLIAVHGKHDAAELSDEYYPPRLVLPLTAFCEVLEEREQAAESGEKQKVQVAVLNLYDPLERTNVLVKDRSVPLESDITTPLAYHLNDPLLNTGVLETLSLFNANLGQDMYGLFMMEPYDPNKIPIVMVHGLWSSPVTWLEMFNDLRANRDLRSNYQFWFYAYPTGQPFWISARQMREDLAALRRDLDPLNEAAALDQMVLVGHSMGGLISRLQTIDSEEDFWQLISKSDFERWDGDEQALEKLQGTFFFEPNEQVKRVITLASPHEGSPLANNLTKWAGQKLFTLPDIITNDFETLARKNAKHVRDRKLLTLSTSIDSLSPDSQFIKVMNSRPLNGQVHFHNIVGNVPNDSFFRKPGVKGAGDGVVALESALAIDAESEIEVEAEHQDVHQHPRSILEVRRILLKHLVATNRLTEPGGLTIPAGLEQTMEKAKSANVHSFECLFR